MVVLVVMLVPMLLVFPLVSISSLLHASFLSSTTNENERTLMADQISAGDAFSELFQRKAVQVLVKMLVLVLVLVVLAGPLSASSLFSLLFI